MEENKEEVLSKSIEEQMQSKGIIKFGPRVRDVNKDYEMNNN